MFMLSRFSRVQLYDPAFLLLVIYPEKTTILKDTYTSKFIAAIFRVAKTRKQPRCPLTDEWIEKLWHTSIMECYSVTKGDRVESVAVRQMNLEPLTQSEVNQKERNKYCILTHACGI